MIYAASERDADLYYATGFWAPDPFIFAEIEGRKILVMSDLEVDRARAQAKADEILSLSKLQAQARHKQGGQARHKQGGQARHQAGGQANLPANASVAGKAGTASPGTAEVLDLLFKERQVNRIRVPGSFPISLADALRAKGYILAPVKDPFFPQRMIKRPEEVAAIRETLRLTEEALKAAMDVIRESEIRDGDLWLRGKPLTSELVRKLLHLTLMGSDCLARETIVSGGAQACDPHCVGSGVLKAHWPIVLDVFPVSLKSRYCADITRTVVKGNPSEKVKRMYAAVRRGQEIAFSMLKPGADGQKIHQAILDHFTKEGFPTGAESGGPPGLRPDRAGGRMTGFFHGTGHGIGLEIHEPPRIGPVSERLQAGQVVTVEPGLYYPDAGGVRLEDDVLITETGCENLTRLPKVLELD